MKDPYLLLNITLDFFKGTTAKGQESKYLILVPPQKKNFRVCANLIFNQN